MGVLIKLPGDIVQYASIFDNLISVQKRPFSDGETTTYTWVVLSTMNIWESEAAYADKKEPVGRYNVIVTQEEQPSDLYAIVYGEYKKSLYDYEDKF